MSTQDKTSTDLTSLLISNGIDARYVGDGVITVGEEEEVIVNVSKNGKYVDVAYAVRDSNGDLDDWTEYLTNGSARNGKRIVRAVRDAITV